MLAATLLSKASMAAKVHEWVEGRTEEEEGKGNGGINVILHFLTSLYLLFSTLHILHLNDIYRLVLNHSPPQTAGVMTGDTL